MNTTQRNSLFIVLGLFLSLLMLSSMNYSTIEVAGKYQVVKQTCSDDSGNVISYGSKCTTGTKNCVENAACGPDGDTVPKFKIH